MSHDKNNRIFYDSLLINRYNPPEIIYHTKEVRNLLFGDHLDFVVLLDYALKNSHYLTIILNK